ncbi:DnaJ domain-containing protein [Xylariaceae sp. FL0804]|nr:DnaJ domain-containing protein [Xylariaceae sp. FL0804]
MASKELDPVEDQDALNALDAEQKEFDKASRSPCSNVPTCQVTDILQDAEIDRILKAFRLDAYAVLDLNPGVAESDIKACYRKKSLQIHPDKTRNERAPEAFDRLKKAQTELMDEKHRARLDECIADARMLLIRERGWTVDSPELKTDPHWARDWRDKAREVLVDAELRRKRQARAQMQEEGREQRRADEELDARKRKRQHEQDWEETRDQRIDSWRQFQKGGRSAPAPAPGSSGPDGAAKKKKKKLKPIG